VTGQPTSERRDFRKPALDSRQPSWCTTTLSHCWIVAGEKLNHRKRTRPKSENHVAIPSTPGVCSVRIDGTDGIPQAIALNRAYQGDGEVGHLPSRDLQDLSGPRIEETGPPKARLAGIDRDVGQPPAMEFLGTASRAMLHIYTFMMSAPVRGRRFVETASEGACRIRSNRCPLPSTSDHPFSVMQHVYLSELDPWATRELRVWPVETVIQYFTSRSTGLTGHPAGRTLNPMVYEKTLNIYTDGSSFPGPRRGGMGILFVTINGQGDEVVEPIDALGHAGATNNEMELLACVTALREAAKHPTIHSVERIVIFTDSLYVKEHVPLAMFQWSRQKWVNRAGRPVENAEIWRDLVRAIQKSPKRVDFEWVKGHAKDVHNKAVDKAAKRSAKGVLQRPLKVSTVRRKLTANKVEVGSIPMHGQVMTIRVVTDTYLRVQRLFKYRYEVLEGEFAGRVDLIFGTEVLLAGHHYEIRVNDTTKNPRIVEILVEIPRS
jgi:ribonuclease HI